MRKLMVKICPECKQEFETYDRRRKYCSRKCYWKITDCCNKKNKLENRELYREYNRQQYQKKKWQKLFYEKEKKI